MEPNNIKNEQFVGIIVAYVIFNLFTFIYFYLKNTRVNYILSMVIVLILTLLYDLTILFDKDNDILMKGISLINIISSILLIKFHIELKNKINKSKNTKIILYDMYLSFYILGYIIIMSLLYRYKGDIKIEGSCYIVMILLWIYIFNTYIMKSIYNLNNRLITYI
jgi:hypothetical protein